MGSATILSEDSLSRRKTLVRIKAFFLVASGTLLLTLSAKINVPFYPVPTTMQVPVVLLLGALLGFRLGLATVTLYLIEGALGLPVFAGTPARGIGIPYLLGPTGGYLIGFLIATAFVGYASDKGWCQKISKTCLTMTVATLLIYLPGLLWLSRFTGLEKVLGLGLFPFLVGDIFKLALTVSLYVAGKRFIERFHCSLFAP